MTTLSATPSQVIRESLRDLMPSLIATSIWGLITGVAMVKTGLSIPFAIVMGFLVYAGTAQLSSLPLFIAGAPIWMIILTAYVVNIRFMIYSANLATHIQHLSKWKQLILGFLNTDGGYLCFLRRQTESPSAPYPIHYFLSGAIANWFGWQIFSITGILLANSIPTSWQLEFGATLAILVLCLPGLKHPVVLLGASIAGICSLLTTSLPMKSGILVSIGVGVFITYIINHFQAKQAKI